MTYAGSPLIPEHADDQRQWWLDLFAAVEGLGARYPATWGLWVPSRWWEDRDRAEVLALVTAWRSALDSRVTDPGSALGRRSTDPEPITAAWHWWASQDQLRMTLRTQPPPFEPDRERAAFARWLRLQHYL
jgi:hypothetical protein